MPVNQSTPTHINDGTDMNDGTDKQVPPTEVTPRAKRRSFSAQYKLRILEEADACSEPGEIGALLRREGLYSSNLTCWRRQREQGQLQGLRPKKRGRKKTQHDEMRRELETLRQQKQQLAARLEAAETIIAVQKKLSTLLGVPQPETLRSDER